MQKNTCKKHNFYLISANEKSKVIHFQALKLTDLQTLCWKGVVNGDRLTLTVEIDLSKEEKENTNPVELKIIDRNNTKIPVHFFPSLFSILTVISPIKIF